MDKRQLASKMIGRIFSTVLEYANISNICYEAMDFGYEAVSLFPNMLGKAREVIDGRDVKLCALITYPHGTFLPEQKAAEIRDALESGADQLEVCMNILNIRSGDWDEVKAELDACRKAAGSHVLKMILEMEYLKDEHIRKTARLAREAGVDCLVTSTGLYNTVDKNKRDVPILVTQDDVKKLRDVSGGQVKIVAQGNVDSLEMAETLLLAGADYIGSERAADIVRACRRREEEHVR